MSVEPVTDTIVSLEIREGHIDYNDVNWFARFIYSKRFRADTDPGSPIQSYRYFRFAALSIPRYGRYRN